MKNAVLSFVISALLSAVFYLVAIAIGLQIDIAKGLAGLPAFAIKNIYEFLEIKTTKSALQASQSSNLIDLDGARLNPFIIFPLALVMYAGMSSMCCAIAGAFVGVAEVAAQAAIVNIRLKGYLIISAAFPLRLIFSFYIGRWIGGRSIRLPYLVAVVAVAGGLLLFFIFSIKFANEDMIKQMYGKQTRYDTIIPSLVSLLPDAIVYILITFAGVWLGRRRRVLRYISIMLRLLPENIQKTVGEIVKDEVNRTKAVSAS